MKSQNLPPFRNVRKNGDVPNHLNLNITLIVWVTDIFDDKF